MGVGVEKTRVSFLNLRGQGCMCLCMCVYAASAFPHSKAITGWLRKNCGIDVVRWFKPANKDKAAVSKIEICRRAIAEQRIVLTGTPRKQVSREACVLCVLCVLCVFFSPFLFHTPPPPHFIQWIDSAGWATGLESLRRCFTWTRTTSRRFGSF